MRGSPGAFRWLGATNLHRVQYTDLSQKVEYYSIDYYQCFAVKKCNNKYSPRYVFCVAIYLDKYIAAKQAGFLTSTQNHIGSQISAALPWRNQHRQDLLSEERPSTGGNYLAQTSRSKMMAFETWDTPLIKSRWWFQIFFIFIPTWGNDPIWLIFFKWVETTNLKYLIENLYTMIIYMHISVFSKFALCFLAVELEQNTHSSRIVVPGLRSEIPKACCSQVWGCWRFRNELTCVRLVSNHLLINLVLSMDKFSDHLGWLKLFKPWSLDEICNIFTSNNWLMFFSTCFFAWFVVAYCFHAPLSSSSNI